LETEEGKMNALQEKILDLEAEISDKNIEVDFLSSEVEELREDNGKLQDQAEFGSGGAGKSTVELSLESEKLKTELGDLKKKVRKSSLNSFRTKIMPLEKLICLNRLRCLNWRRIP
jgi:uncharacterized protein involved in exopolysaccharide biosynthesis